MRPQIILPRGGNTLEYLYREVRDRFPELGDIEFKVDIWDKDIDDGRVIRFEKGKMLISRKVLDFPESLIKALFALSFLELIVGDKPLLKERMLRRRFPYEYEVYRVFDSLIKGKVYVNEELLSDENYKNDIRKVAEALK